MKGHTSPWKYTEMRLYPVGSIVLHRGKPEFGYGIIVNNFHELADLAEQQEGLLLENDELVAIVLWHGDEDKELIDIPQIHTYAELKLINTEVGFA